MTCDVIFTNKNYYGVVTDYFEFMVLGSQCQGVDLAEMLWWN